MGIYVGNELKQNLLLGNTEVKRIYVGESLVMYSDLIEDIQSRMIAANDGTSTISYIVSGDSTRDNSYNSMIDYYEHQLAKANITLIDNASSGQSGQDWAGNIDSPNVSQAIAATTGTGSTTILEFSFGINDDKNGATKEQVKGWLRNGIKTYQKAKPDAVVLLVVPVATSNTTRNNNLKTIYQELSIELGLPLIDGLYATSTVHGNTSFYNDGTHPNKNGSIRMVNYILSEISPPELYSVIDLDDTFIGAGDPPSNAEMATTVESGYWSTSAGTPVVNAAWRRMQRISVEPNFVLRIQHQGNRNDVAFYDQNDVYISTVTSTAISGQPYREVEIPTGAWYVRLNISSNATTYDALGDIPSVKYVIPSIAVLTMAQINNGLEINLVDNSI